ncbi:hypothetical protein AN392_02686 [Pseudoalteromonas sp. P1-16-1b]|uniref:hypothetical protein n=1 Tax=Pseudoalteromonas sp. P1-16-1b TaxID=1723757 RepID=UPI0006D65EA7|nr:hypothetical protein [Pseudoalteromonas sp. P1-16-1b]KPZ64173.1 hypothetical protein AN392_02686 [Pseudoalteromonas sp. P1-16-1b]
MHKHTFIDRYFHSQKELLDFRSSDERDINTLYSYLNNLHSVADKLKDLFDCNIKNSPEFKILRLIRNYFHHVGDVDEVRLIAVIPEHVLISHTQNIIIPLETFAKSVKSFIDNNVVEGRKDYQRKMDFVTKELSIIGECFSYLNDILTNMKMCCDKPSLKLDGVVYELGFDMYKFVYNITNLIADSCRSIDELACKTVITSLDESYTVENNIGKIDTLYHPGKMKTPVTTMNGMIYPKNSIELAI